MVYDIGFFKYIYHSPPPKQIHVQVNKKDIFKDSPMAAFKRQNNLRIYQ